MARVVLLISLLSVLSCGYFYNVLDGTSILTERDLAVFFIPPRILWTGILKAGEFPLWNPYFYSGHPLLATLQPGIFYPVNLLLLALPFDTGFNWTIIVHFFMAGAFMYLLAREIDCSYSASLVASLTYMLSGYLFSTHNVISTLFTVAWAPLSILLMLRTLRAGSIFYACATGVVLTVMFMAGGIEVLFGTAVFLACLAVTPAALDFNRDREYPALTRRSLYLVLCVAVFVLLSSVQLLPFLELSRASTRAGGLTYFEATTWSLDLKDFIQFFIPDPFGYGVSDDKYWANQSWLKTIYTGSIPFILCAFFLLRTNAKKTALPLFFIALVGLSLALGRNNALYYYLYEYAPFFAKIRYPVKFLFIVFIVISVVSALGYDSLAREVGCGASRRAKTAVFVLLALSTIAALSFGFLSFYDTWATDFLVRHGIDFPRYNRVGINLFNTKRALFFFILISVSIYGCVRYRALAAALPYLVITILVVDLFFAHNGYYFSTDSKAYHKRSAVADFLAPDKSLYRVFVTPRTLEQGPRSMTAKKNPGETDYLEGLDLDKERLTGYNLEYRIFDINGMDVMRRSDYMFLHHLMASQSAPDSTNILQMLNVKYVISIPRISSPEFVLKKIVSSGKFLRQPGLEDKKTIKVYENRAFLPRFYLVNSYIMVKNPQQYVDMLTSKRFHPQETALLEEAPLINGLPAAKETVFGAPGGQMPAQGSVEVLSYRNNSVTLRVDSKSPAVLVASESCYPGWKVYIDGKEGRLLKADFVLRALAVDAGTHEVRFVYSPASFRAGAYISSATALLLLVGGMIRIKRKTDG